MTATSIDTNSAAAEIGKLPFIPMPGCDVAEVYHLVRSHNVSDNYCLFRLYLLRDV